MAVILTFSFTSTDTACYYEKYSSLACM